MKTAEHALAFEAGKTAFRAGYSTNDNPHFRGSDEWVAWADGFIVAMQAEPILKNKLLRELRKKARAWRANNSTR